MDDRTIQGRSRPLTHKTLTAERNYLLIGFAVMFGLNLWFGTAFHFGLPDWQLLGGFAPFLAGAARVVYVYLVYHTSRFLAQPVWLRLIYSALAIFAGFELIPLVGLLVSIARTRGMIEDKPN